MKVGSIDYELNTLSKLLLMFMAFLSFLIVFLNGFEGNWFILYFRLIYNHNKNHLFIDIYYYYQVLFQ